MSHFYVLNIEVWCYPLSPWYPARYENGFYLAHGPLFTSISPKVFAFFPGPPPGLPPLYTSSNCHYVMSLRHHCHVISSCRLVMSYCHTYSLLYIQTKHDIIWIIYTNQVQLVYSFTGISNMNWVNTILHMWIRLHMWTVKCRVVSVL